MKIILKINKSIKILLITTAFGLSFTGQSFALDSNAFINRLQGVMNERGFKIEPGKIAVNGNTITIDDAKIIKKDTSEDEGNISVQKWVFNDVKEAGKGDYSVGTSKINEVNFSFKKANQVIIAHEVKLKKIFLKADKAGIESAPFESLLIKKVNFDDKGKSAAVIDNFAFDYTKYNLEKNIKLAVNIGNMSIDVSSLDKSAQEQFSKMGFSRLEIQGKLNYDINLVNGNNNLILQGNMNDAGKLDANVNLGGMTKDLYQEFMRRSQQMSSDSKQDTDAASIGRLGLIQQLSLNSIDIKFDDKSITNKIIDLNKGDNTKRENFVAQLKMILPFALSQLQHPEFAEKINKQVGMYLDNPDNLEIMAKPDKETPFAVIAAAAITSRKQLIDLLKLDVKANQ